MADLWQPPRGRGGRSNVARTGAEQGHRGALLRLAGAALVFIGSTAVLGGVAGAAVAVGYAAGEGMLRRLRARRAGEVFARVGDE